MLTTVIHCQFKINPETHLLEPPLLPPRCALAESWSQELELGIEPGNSIQLWYVVIPHMKTVYE